jgi:hypothetical protein
MSELKHILGTSVNLYKGKPNQLIDKLKIKNYFGGDSTKGAETTLLNNSVDCFPSPLCLSTRLFICGSLLFTMFLTSPR